MGIRFYKPVTAGRRGASVSDFSEITDRKKRPEKSLTTRKKKNGGRNNQGKITARHRGGGHKRLFRAIDFRRDKDGIVARVTHIEYDPNRSSRIALLEYADGEKRYILAPEGLAAGATVESGAKKDKETDQWRKKTKGKKNIHIRKCGSEKSRFKVKNQSITETQRKKSWK